MRNELVLIRHSDEPADDRVFTYARMNGLVPIETFPFRGDRLGEPTENTLGTVVYGGMFNVFEEEKHPFLHEENRWIRACMDANLPVLGLCQGAQQIARILGAQVGPTPDNRHEFGYYEVTPTTDAGSFLTEPSISPKRISIPLICHRVRSIWPEVRGLKIRPSVMAKMSTGCSFIPNARSRGFADGRKIPRQRAVWARKTAQNKTD